MVDVEGGGGRKRHATIVPQFCIPLGQLLTGIKVRLAGVLYQMRYSQAWGCTAATCEAGIALTI